MSIAGSAPVYEIRCDGIAGRRPCPRRTRVEASTSENAERAAAKRSWLVVDGPMTHVCPSCCDELDVEDDPW